MRRKRRASESPPLPPFEYMSRNRRAVFGDPPSAYLAAVIERNERARRERERSRLENEQNQGEEELPRKKPALRNNQGYSYRTPATENDYLVWSCRGTPASNTYALSGSSHSQFADLESNGESREQSDSITTDQIDHAGDESDGYGDEDTEKSPENSGQDESEGFEENYGNGDERFQGLEDSDNVADMADDENTTFQRQDPRASPTIVTDKDEEDAGNRQDCKREGGSNIFVNKDIRTPFPLEVDGDTTSLLPSASNNALHAQRRFSIQRSFAVSNHSTSHMFSLPGAIFVDPVDFDDDDIRSLAHNLARTCTTLGFEGNEVLPNENTPPTEPITRNPGHRPVGHRYSPFPQGQGVFHANSSRSALLPNVSTSTSEATFDESLREENDGTVQYPDEFASNLEYQIPDW
ncbi:hypothetical protein I7I48_09153 [Histoplasma ohiense]|nr:hypothetical protein I7I48_09153 [Histoplasma ohiense (nom. inval.)]